MLLRSLLLVLSATLSATAQTAAADYTPTTGRCPPDFRLIRRTGTSPHRQRLSSGESDYVRARQSKVVSHVWKHYLATLAATNVTLPRYVSRILTHKNPALRPNPSIAVSGGGYRAAIFAAGVLNVLDGRNASSVHEGTGGFLQAATYLSGLSGGGWLVTSLTQASFPTISELIFGSPDPAGYSGWLTEVDVFVPSTNFTVDLQYIEGLTQEIVGKHAAGFPVTITDIWARGLSRHFLNGTTAADIFNTSLPHGAGITFSSLANVSSFKSHSQPFPILIADLQSIHGNRSNIDASDDLIPLSNPIFEFNPYEMGSFDPVLAAFTPTRYLGTSNSSICTTGFDQASYIIGTSSALFNDFNTSASAFLNSSVGPVSEILNASLPQPGVELDTSSYPNPFFGIANGTFIASNEEFLQLVDGGEDGEVIPIQPLLVKARKVDVIMAIDASADVDNFANGTSLIASRKRATLFHSSYSFPHIPNNTLTFVSQNLTTRPTFFGCNSKTDGPLLIYLANGGPPRNDPVAVTNTSTNQLSYPPSQVQAMLDQAFLIATQGIAPNGSTTSSDPEWPACLACAIVDRARDRSGIRRSGVCASCLARYCWNGTETS